MIFERIKTPGIAHVAYLIGNQGQGAVVDPRRDVGEYVKLARRHKLTIKYAIETHRQEDFVMGSAELARQCGAKVVNGRHGAFGHGDIRLDDGEGFELAQGIRLVALHTPGHTPESMCYAVYLDDAPDRAWAVFTGDTLFIGETGRTDLTDPSKTAEHAGQLYDAVHAKLLPLGDQTILLPAHGAGSVCGGNIAERDDSTIGLERSYNPVFVRSRDEFIKGKLDERIPRPPYFRHMEQVNSQGGMGPLTSASAVRVLQPKDFQTECRRGLVFDLRRPEAFAGGHVPGSYSIWSDGLSVFAGWVAEAGTPIYLVLDDAATALDDAVKALGRVGLDYVQGVLAGSFEAWRDHGLPMAGLGTVEAGRIEVDPAQRDLRVIDVRDDVEFETEGHIPGVSHLYVGYVERELARLQPPFDPEAPVVVTCGVGHRASLAASMLMRRGARDVRNLLGGMEAWQKLERRVELGACANSVTTPDVEGPRR
ncbi:MBL fold metallo-hydrolase [Roseateles sp.]|uniref:MBL fold metallo-hydrolase n=1 Tax=Roseateles sp. TaxID=1971397 RepID=UPI0040366186